MSENKTENKYVKARREQLETMEKAELVKEVLAKDAELRDLRHDSISTVNMVSNCFKQLAEGIEKNKVVMLGETSAKYVAGLHEECEAFIERVFGKTPKHWTEEESGKIVDLESGKILDAQKN